MNIVKKINTKNTLSIHFVSAKYPLIILKPEKQNNH